MSQVSVCLYVQMPEPLVSTLCAAEIPNIPDNAKRMRTKPDDYDYNDQPEKKNAVLLRLRPNNEG